MTNYERYKNQKNNDNIIWNFYIYNKETRKSNINEWRCSKKDCKAIGSVDDTDNFVASYEHNHTNHKIKIEKNLAVQLIKKKAKEGECNNIKIVTEVTKTLSDDVITTMPKFKTLTDECTRIKNQAYENMGDKYDDIPDFLKRTLNDEKFLQFDNRTESVNRYIILFSENSSIYITTGECPVLIDGTFWCVPSPFTQLLTFKFLLFGKFVPLIYILMSRKDEESYNEAFLKLLSLSKCRFKSVTIDFEMALVNSLESVFFGIPIYGCAFHFGQAVWRQIQKLGLSTYYTNNSDFNINIRRLLNLIFVPINAIENEYKRIIDNILLHNYPEQFLTFIKYFEKNFITTEFKKSKYKSAFWNCFTRVKSNLPRTTNCLEAFHRVLNSKFNTAHVNLGKFLEVLIQENERVRVILIQSRNKIDLPKKNFVKEEKIRVIVDNFCNFNDFEFFDSLNDVIGWKFDDL